jgi:putative membrane protein
MRLLALIPAAALLMAGPAGAQIGNPGGVTAGTPQVAPGTPVPHSTNNTDRLFARLIAVGGAAEVELAELAQQKATDGDVKDFAQMMIRDHSTANDQFAELARSANIPLPEELHPDHQAVLDRLRGLSGRDFDLAYILAQIEDHQKTVQLLQWEIGSGQDAPLQQFAAETLPTVFGHLREAQFVASKLTGQAPPEIAPRMSSAKGERPAMRQ